MKTNLDLDPKALKIAKDVAKSRKVSLGTLVSDVLLYHFMPKKQASVLPIGTTELGLPALYVGHTVTPEEVEAATQEE
jgi:hypothetical protein